MELWHPLGELVSLLEHRALTGGLENVWEAVREEKWGASTGNGTKL